MSFILDALKKSEHDRQRQASPALFEVKVGLIRCVHHVLLAGERIHEVPISYKARGREAGKKLTAVDGLRVVRTLARCRVT